MTERPPLDPANRAEIQGKAVEIAREARALAHNLRGDTEALLLVLRALEGVHREIRDELFLESLPENRHALYDLLRELETRGGWPYIPRMKLRALLSRLQG